MKTETHSSDAFIDFSCHKGFQTYHAVKQVMAYQTMVQKY